jgi:cytochrome c nitrite reductase small subunit
MGNETRPRRAVVFLLILLFGAAGGLGIYTFIYAKGYSYLSNDPASCANCHAMEGHLNGWVKSTHHAVATCNDCHLPEGVIDKAYTKGSNGFWHSFYFTTGRYPDPIRIKPHNHDVVEANCRRCHGDTVEAMDGPAVSSRQKISCVRCHDEVGHS